MELIKGHNKVRQGGQGAIADYQRTMVLTQFSRNGSPIKKWKFINAWPSAVSEIALAWDAPAIEEFTCSWNYDYWRPVKWAKPVPETPEKGFTTRGEFDLEGPEAG